MAQNIPALQKNVMRNAWVTSWIERLYSGALFALTILFLSKIVPAVRQGITPANELTIALILGALSIQSLTFYHKLVIKLRENEFGQMLSIWLVIVLLLLIVIGMFYPLLFLIGIGIGFICWKALLLYQNSKKFDNNEISKKYFKRILITYVTLFLLILPLGILADKETIYLFPKDQSLQAYEKAREEITNLSLVGNQILDSVKVKQEIDSLGRNVDELYANWKEVKTRSNTILFGGILALLIVIVYGAYKGALIRKYPLEYVLKELEGHYKKYYEEHPNEDPTKSGE
ncbi:MAG: hypothetical protein HZB59_06760 [Ignavibacteriales bacterium]|nr:hypothetical protein [Ignavibacteriales bacterium]